MAVRKKVTKAVKKTVKAKAKPAKAVKAKSIAKKAPVKAAAKKKALSVSSAFTKSQCVQHICETTELKKAEVIAVLDSFSDLIHAHIKPKGPGQFTWPGLLKIVVTDKPATPAKWGTNPFTGEKMKFKAKPKSRRVKVRPLKGLKEMA